MKRFISAVLSLLCAGSVFAANPTYVTEPFNKAYGSASPNNWIVLFGNGGTAKENVRKMMNTVDNSGSGFIWGAWNAQATPAKAIAVQPNTATPLTGCWSNAICINGPAAAVTAGTRIYTRFDTSAITEATTNTNVYSNPSTTIDCSQSNSRAIIDLSWWNGDTTDLQWAILLRDGNGRWFESAPKGLASNTTSRVSWNLTGTGATTWTQVDCSAAATGDAGRDMDQCDSNGGPTPKEATLSYLATPEAPIDLVNIQGMGIIIKAPVGTASTSYGAISALTIGSLPVTTPTGLTLTQPSATTINLDWADVAGATGYNVYRATTPTGPFMTPMTNDVRAAASAYSDTTALAGTAYYYCVTAVKDYTESDQSVIVNNLPAAPQNLKAVTNASKVDLSWDVVAGAAGYMVFRGTTAGGPYTALTASAITAATYQDTPPNNVTCYYVVKALDANSVPSANSNEVSALVKLLSNARSWLHFN